MSRLQTDYGNRVDFIHLDWDDPGGQVVYQHYGVLRRSTYILLDPKGDILWQWVGPLNYDLVAAEVEKALASFP